MTSDNQELKIEETVTPTEEVAEPASEEVTPAIETEAQS